MKSGLTRVLAGFGVTLWLGAITALFASASFAGNGSQQFELSEQEYLQRSFVEGIPPTKRVWIRGELKEQVEAVLQHRAGFIRTKYWLDNDRSVWVLNEVGKERAITVAVTVDRADDSRQGSLISDVTILAFRESRGWEIKHDFFTKQFIGAGLNLNSKKKGLNARVDGISGATLSVRAVKKMAEIALLLDREVRLPTIQD